jgi:hypothetical protein
MEKINATKTWTTNGRLLGRLAAELQFEMPGVHARIWSVVNQTLYRVCQHRGGWLVALGPHDWQSSSEKFLGKVRADSAAQALDFFHTFLRILQLNFRSSQ